MHTAENFDERVGISGVVLTRMDGDGRGGAALSMRAITGKPIKFVGLGEKMDALETFEPERVAGRILGMGDIVALVEKAQATLEAEQAERMMKRFQKGQFNMNDLKMQLEQMLKMGGMKGMMQMMPGMGKMARQVEDSGMDDRVLRQQIALINSMTKKERANPQILQASRKKRIAAGSGLQVSDLNKLLKMQRQMGDMMKKMGKMGKGGMMKQAMRGMFGKGGMPRTWIQRRWTPRRWNRRPSPWAARAACRAWAAVRCRRGCRVSAGRSDRHHRPYPDAGDGPADPAGTSPRRH